MIGCSCHGWLAVAMTICLSGVVMGDVKLSHMSTVYLPYNTSSSGPLYNLSSHAVEQVSYDPQEKIIYAAGEGVFHVIDSSDPGKLALLYSQYVDDMDLTDVEVCGDHVFITADNQQNETDGQLLVYKKHRRGGKNVLALERSVLVGANPDNIQTRPGCKSVVIALEAEGYSGADGKIIDPEGAVVLISWPNGVQDSAQTIKTLNFHDFNNKVETLVKSGVRFVYRENSNTFSNDVEPEYVTIDNENNKAYVCLQENNGIAEVDLATEKITQVYGLGYKQWGVLDASDRDRGIQLSYWPIRAWYQPDAIQFVSWKGRKLVITANEGGSKRYTNFRESSRGKQFQDADLGNEIPDIVKHWLKDDSQLGRLKFSKLDGKDASGKYQALYTYGARSFSIWDAADNFRLVSDSGFDIENTTAMRCPHAFNTEGVEVDEKSDSKGPEPESIAVAQLGDRLYIFIGNENPGTIFVYSLGDDVTKPRFEAISCDGFPDDSRTLQEKYDAKAVYGLDPEDLKFISGADSPNGSPFLIVAGAESGTVTTLKVDVTP